MFVSFRITKSILLAFARTSVRVTRYAFSGFINLFLLNVYVDRLKVRAANLQSCLVCGAPIALSREIVKREKSQKLTKCVFCSTQLGWEYRPFELQILRRARWHRLAYASLAIATIAFTVFVFNLLETERCRNAPVAERLISGCIQPSTLSANAVNLSVREDSVLPEQDRLLQAVLLSNVRRLQFKLSEQFLFDVEASTMPLSLSPNGEWLLLKHSDQQLEIRPVSERQEAVIRFDPQVCQLEQATSAHFVWSPDAQRIVISAILEGVRRVKLATLDTASATIERCDDVYSQNVSAVSWIDDRHLLYLIEEDGRKRFEVRAADSSRLVFSSELQLADSTLSDLQVSPSGRYVLFTSSDPNGQKQLYWLDFSGLPTLHTLQSAEQRVHPSSFFGWANEHQIAYLNHEGQLVLLDLQMQTLSFMAMPSNTVWMAWRGAN